MKVTRTSAAMALTLLLALVVLAACHSADPAGVTGNNEGGTVNPGVNLSADPLEIVIDTTDPAAPTDPDTGERIGTTMVTAMVTDAAGDPQPDVEVVFSSDAGTLDSEGMALLTDVDGIAYDLLTVFESGPNEVEVTAEAGGMTGSIVVTVTLILPNEPPVADAGPDQIIECASPTETSTSLDGSASSDADSSEGTNDDIVSFEWYLDFDTSDPVLLGEGQLLDVGLAPGLNIVTLQVTDSEGESATDEVEIDIQDNTPPELSVTLDPSLLWPPNHRMVDIEASLTVVEACSAQPAIVLLDATSNEPDNGTGDGDTVHDIQGADLGEEDYDLQLRAERAGSGDGRVYTVTYQVTDDAGLVTESSAEVVVTHDKGAD